MIGRNNVDNLDDTDGSALSELGLSNLYEETLPAEAREEKNQNHTAGNGAELSEPPRA